MQSRHNYLILPLLFVLLLLSAAVSAQTSYFLKIPDIPGESTDANYEDQICVTSYSWELNRPEGTGRVRGAAESGPFVISKALDKASTELFFAAASARVFPEIELTIVLPNPQTGERQRRATIVFSDVIISSFQTGGTVGEEGVREVVTFQAEAVEMTYYEAGGGSTQRAWDFDSNTGG